MIKFKGKEIKGSHATVVFAAPEPQFRDTFFWGLNGESRIYGGNKGRLLTCYMWLHDDYIGNTGLDGLLETLQDLDDMVGEFGRLEETYEDVDNAGRDYRDCHFVGFVPEVLVGQQSPGPVDGGDRGNDVDGMIRGWIQAGTLSWRQVKV